MNREDFVGLAAAINLAGIHEGNDGQRKTRIDAAVTMAHALADALGMGGSGANKGGPVAATPTSSTPPPGSTFGEDSASVAPTPGQMHPERAARLGDEPVKPTTLAPPHATPSATPSPTSHEHERIQPEHKAKHDEPRKTGPSR